MSEQIRYVYDQMETMIAIFEETAKQLDETTARMNAIANTLDQGALLGTTGDTMAASIRQDLNASIDRLKMKMLEESGDIRKSIDLMKQADSQAGTAFN